jgi:hypothetical protein
VCVCVLCVCVCVCVCCVRVLCVCVCVACCVLRVCIVYEEHKHPSGGHASCKAFRRTKKKPSKPPETQVHKAHKLHLNGDPTRAESIFVQVLEVHYICRVVCVCMCVCVCVFLPYVLGDDILCTERECKAVTEEVLNSERVCMEML